MGMNDQDLAGRKEAVKNEIKRKTLSYFKEKIKRTGNEETK